uniref:ATP-dependent RNA helicase n=1 Tax=Catharus ustulatus TaxID=91951 RepID=A0A8C3Y809_CATUS
MLRAVLTDTRWSSDQASGSSPLAPCCSRTAGSRRTAVSRNPALAAAAAAASSTTASSPSGGSSRPAAQSGALKRKLQSPHGNPPVKRKRKLSINTFRKGPTEADRREEGSSAQKPAPKKQLNDKQNESQKSRPFIKTSSLFKNNPDIPEIHRKEVQQVQENVFTTDSFSQLDLHPHLVSGRKVKQTIPVLLQGRDALVRSQTGSGKTLAYGIPLVQCLQGMESKIQRSDGPYALVLVPTRENHCWSWFSFLKSEKARLRKGINILISTPGRLVDHIKSTECIHFRRTQWLIIDEADRILDLGFEKDVAVILNALNAERETRQNVLLSATLSEGVTRLADISLNDPVSISIADEIQKLPAPVSQTDREASNSSNCMGQENFAVPETLQQYVMVVPSKLRLVTLAAFILQKCKFEKRHKMIIFFSSCEQVEFYHELLVKVLSGGSESEQPGHSPLSSVSLRFLRLHGDMEQEVSTLQISPSPLLFLIPYDLLCAARGLDLPQVTWIVQYNAPASPAEYIHRIGRTARIGCRGSSLLVLAPSEAGYVSLLASHKINVSELKMEKVLASLMKDDRFKLHRPGRKKSCGKNPQEVQERATVLQTKFENHVHSSEDTVRWAKKALQSFLCAYTTYPKELKHIFHIKSLHLGHVAKSFGLRDAPQNLTALPAAGSKRKTKPTPKRSDLLKKTHGKRRLAEILRSEYSSGMDTAGAKVKKKKKRKQRKAGARVESSSLQTSPCLQHVVIPDY